MLFDVPDLGDVPDLVGHIAEQVSLTPQQAIGIPIALVGAALLSIGTQYQHRGVTKVQAMAAAHSPSVTGLSVGQLGLLIRRPSWVIGTALLAIAIVVQLSALWFAPLLIVQPLGAFALVITAILNARLSGIKLGGPTIRAIILCVAGVGLFVTIAAFVATTQPVTEVQLQTVLVILAVVLVGWAVLYLLFRHKATPMFYIVGAGMLYGFVATIAKVVMSRIQTLMLSDFQFSPAEWLTIGCLIGLGLAALLGMYFVQSAHANGPPDLVVAGLTVIDPITAVLIGVIVLGEAAHGNAWSTAGFIVTGAIAVFGVWQLARHHPHMNDESALPAASPGPAIEGGSGRG